MELSRLWQTLHNNWIWNSAEVSYSIKASELRFNFKVTEPSISTWIKAMSKKWDSDIHWKAESVLRKEFGSCNHDGSNQDFRVSGRPIETTSVEMYLLLSVSSLIHFCDNCIRTAASSWRWNRKVLFDSSRLWIYYHVLFLTIFSWALIHRVKRISEQRWEG